MPEEIIEKQRNKFRITPREVIFKYIWYVPWLIISVGVMMAAAYIKLRYSPSLYNVSGKLLVSQQNYNNGGEKFDDIFMMQRPDKINDEIEIIRARSMAARVIKSLGLQRQVFNKGKIRSSIVYVRDVPFNFEVLSIADSLVGFSLLVTLEGDNGFILNEQPKRYFFNQVVDAQGVRFRITGNNGNRAAFSSNDFVISWVPLENMAAGLSGSIGVNRVNEGTNVLGISYQTENTRLGIDIVNQYMREYQLGSLEDKREIAAKTLSFIDEQLDTVFRRLSRVETNLQQFKENKRIFNPETQTDLILNQLKDNNKELSSQEVQMYVIDYLINYLSDGRNERNIISASMLGVEEPTLLQQVTEFNKLQLQRETSKNIPSGNPVAISIDANIARLRSDMIENLGNIRHAHELALNELKNKNKEVIAQIGSMPSREKQLVEVTRQQNILQELYSYLLQKKLETAIASASTISNIKVVESAMSSGAPISPNRKGLYIIALFIGIALPVGIVFLLEYLNDKVSSKNEVEQMTSAPILGEVGHAGKAGTLVVTRNNRKFLAEQFRIIRSNLQYILPKVEKPVILVTSSFSGEGKSFISTNLGSVLALSGKRTVILEFDIRKPKILKGLGLSERKGITNYLVSNISLKELIHPVPEVENLL
ncbi:GumC family protein [Paraflavitalea speifideaquila]|uniref:GumC family protein n=1 Tax=Paraflavitalea speifideaquila TaxID=3076558 RepID=UPI0028EC0B99|nr:GNVR domain-containing protein [Paraflavitalea speifideiaquila]